MHSNPLKLLAEKGPVTFLLMCRSFLAEEIHRALLDRRRNVTVHPSVEVDSDATFGTAGTVTVARDCRIRERVVVSPSGGHIEIGENSLLNISVTLLGHGSITLGSDVLVGPQTTIVAANHTYEDPDTRIVQQEITREGIEIRDDVWIGANCTVLDGVTIGEGAVVAAGSVVTDSVPPYTVVAGAPAEVVSERAPKLSA